MKLVRLLACVLLALVVPGLASGSPQAEQGGHQRGFKLYSASLAVGVDNGVVTDDGSIDDNVGTFIPMALAYRGRSPRGDLQFIYEPEFEAFNAHGELNAWNHAAAAAYSFDATPDLNFRTGGSFLHTHDRSRQNTGLVVSPYGLYVEGRAYFSFDYRFNRNTSMSAGVNSWYLQTDVAESASASGSIDELTSSLNVSVSRSIGSVHQVSIDYAHLVSTLVNPEDLPAGTNVIARGGQDTLDVRYTLSFPSQLRLEGSVGTIRLSREEGRDQYTYSLSGRFDKVWRRLTVGGGYRRSLGGLVGNDTTLSPADQVRDPLLSGNIAEWVNFELTGQLGRRLRIGHQVGLSRTFVQNFDESIDSVFASLYGEFVVVDRLAPFVNIWYWDQNTTDVAPSVSRTRFLAGLRVFWDAPLAAGELGAHETVRSILPVRRVQ